jgi:hypothetical protein
VIEQENPVAPVMAKVLDISAQYLADSHARRCQHGRQRHSSKAAMGQL